MLMGSEVYNRIESSGMYGIRRVDLRKEFGKDVDKHVEELVSQGLVFMDKKNGAITYWSKDGYLRYILESDPKLRLLQELILREKEKEDVISKIELEDTIREMVTSIVNEKLINLDITKEILNIKDSLDNIISNYSSLSNYISKLKDELNPRISSMDNKLEELDKGISSTDTRLSGINSELSERISMLDANLKDLNDEVKDLRLLNERVNELSERIEESKAYTDTRLDSLMSEHRSLNDNIGKGLSRLEDSIVRIESRIDRVDELHNELRQEVDRVSKSMISTIDSKVSSIVSELKAYTDTRLDSVVNEQRLHNEKINNRLSNLEDSINVIESRIASEFSRVDSITKDLLEVKSELNAKISYINELAAKVDDILTTLNAIKVSVDGKNGNGNSYDSNTVTLEQFRIDFDRMLAESSSSIGWVELASMRERMCRRYNISAHEFYTLVAQLIEHYNSRYELSSGGQEGVVIRGLVHGFVRRI